MFKSITVSKIASPYDCIIGSGALGLLTEKIPLVTNARRFLVITDDTVDSLYSDKLLSLLSDGGFDCVKFVFPHGENHKNLGTVSDILEFAADNRFTRSDGIIALGGGICGDVAGFAAAIMLRGIDFIQIPTTFLAMIDSSVGGKTGVNLVHGKNLAGAFYQPKLVICDTDFLDTLPPERFSDGTAEAIKYGAVFDKALFDRLASDFRADISDIIYRCIQLKATVVAEDEFDNGRRQLLNFGHTIGHAIEKCSDFEISHGHAVAIGMVMAARAAYKTGISSEDFSPAIADILSRNNLPSSTDIPASDLLSVMLLDKKRKSGSITLVLPKKIGECVLHKIPVCELENFINLAI